MKIKTSEATNTQIDWLVAKCEGKESTLSVDGNGELFNLEAVDGEGMWMRYSTNWTQGGPIIDREGISIASDTSGVFEGFVWFASVDDILVDADEAVGVRGPTPLIAAMRCYVASKLGDEVEIPEELT